MPSGLGLFQPSEIAYKNPGQYKATLAAIGNKEADYLASMDQFFAQLDEMKREFDVSAEQKNRQFEEEMLFKQEELEWQSQENAYNRSSQEQMASDRLDVEKEQIQAQSEISGQQFSLKRQELDEIRSNNEFMRELYGAKEERAAAAESYSAGQLYGSDSSATNALIFPSGDGVYNPYTSSSMPDWLY